MIHQGSTLMKNNFLIKNQFGIFYFRLKIPQYIAILIPNLKTEIKISLKTKDKSKALKIARHQKVMFDFLFDDLIKSVEMRERTLMAFAELPPMEQDQLLLKQRAKEAINDQQYTQQLFLLLERKDRIKKAFTRFEALSPLSLSDIDLSSVDKINHFVAIIDLLSSPTLIDASPYISEIKLKPKINYTNSNGSTFKETKIAQLKVSRKKIKPPLSTPDQIKKTSQEHRLAVGNTVLNLVDNDFDPDLLLEDQEDILLTGITLENAEDHKNFANLLLMLEKGESVNASDFEAFSKPVIVPKTMLRTSEIFEKYYIEVSPEWKSPKTHTANKAIYQNFLDICGDKFIDQLSYDDARYFIDVMVKLPANRNKLNQFKGKAIADLLAMVGTFEPMTITNVNKNIEKLSSVFLFAERKKYIDKNIFDGMKIRNKVQRKKNALQRDRFDDDDLKKIFNSPPYTKDGFDRTYKYWLPLLGLYSGARLGELAQLRLNDIYTKDRVWLFDFNEDEDKQIKTINGIRQVPIHKSLIKLGFLDYVSHLNGYMNTEL